MNWFVEWVLLMDTEIWRMETEKMMAWKRFCYSNGGYFGYIKFQVCSWNILPNSTLPTRMPSQATDERQPDLWQIPCWQEIPSIKSSCLNLYPLNIRWISIEYYSIFVYQNLNPKAYPSIIKVFFDSRLPGFTFPDPAVPCHETQAICCNLAAENISLCFRFRILQWTLITLGSAVSAVHEVVTSPALLCWRLRPVELATWTCEDSVRLTCSCLKTRLENEVSARSWNMWLDKSVPCAVCSLLVVLIWQNLKMDSARFRG